MSQLGDPAIKLLFGSNIPLTDSQIPSVSLQLSDSDCPTPSIPPLMVIQIPVLFPFIATWVLLFFVIWSVWEEYVSLIFDFFFFFNFYLLLKT